MTRNFGIETFTLTEDHVKLLRRMYVDWYDGGYYGSPIVGSKRPYGNSDVPGDVFEILGWERTWDEDEDEGMSEEEEERALKIHRETDLALQVVLSVGAFVPGNFIMSRPYDRTSWMID